MAEIKIEKSPRIDRIIKRTFEKLPQIEHHRAVIVTKSYIETEEMPITLRRAIAFKNICEKLPIVIRPEELIIGSNTLEPRSCQTFPEYSHEWLEKEFDTVEKRSADPFYISDESKKILTEVHKYWVNKTTSDLAQCYMAEETKKAIEHNVFTVGNYFYNGIGHVCVQYDKILKSGFKGIIKEAEDAKKKLDLGHGDFSQKTAFLESVIISANAAITFGERYSKLALEEAEKTNNLARKEELLKISEICSKVPANGATSFYEACQSFWFIQLLLQTESSGHSISPGRFDQYMYPFLKSDLDTGRIDLKFAQELIDCIWIKLNDINKVRDAGSAEGFAGYSLFQNLIVGGQDSEGVDATNIMSYMCLEASMHVMLPAPSLSVRIWGQSPNEFMLKAAALVRTGIGLPAYYNDEAIITALQSRGVSLEDARDYCIIGCVEPQKGGKTDGWHDAAFFNMLKPLEMVFSRGYVGDELVGVETGSLNSFKSYENFLKAYKDQMEYFVKLLANACNAIDISHKERCPLPFQSSMIEDCIGRGKSLQEGGAIYNFTGPQGFGIANMADSLLVIKQLVYNEKKFTLEELKESLDNNFGYNSVDEDAMLIATKIAKYLIENNKKIGEKEMMEIYLGVLESKGKLENKDQSILNMINQLPKFGNDIDEVDAIAREVAYLYTKPVQKYTNPRGGQFQAGLYPVSANVPLGQQTGATPDGRYANTPIADGVGPAQGRDSKGPTAAANSVAKLDHIIASNGTLYNQKFHPSALSGINGLQNFSCLIRGFFDKKGMHMQFNVVDRQTLLDAQANPDKYKGLIVRVAGYSALFTTLSKSLQDDIISRTTQGL